MKKLLNIAYKAENSSFYRWLLSLLLNRLIPFNHPHRFRIKSLSPHHLEVFLPYHKRNLNHLKGLHACALATLCEISSGLSLILKMDPTRYRLILKSLEMKYHYQAKSGALARFNIDDQWLQANVIGPLEDQEKIEVVCPVEIHDEKGNHIASGTATWQLKNWKSVKTQV